MDCVKLLEEWRTSLTNPGPTEHAASVHTHRLPVSQYTYDPNSAACACISLATAHFLLKMNKAVQLQPLFSLGFAEVSERDLVECIENGHRWWKLMQTQHSAQLPRYMTPFQVMGFTKNERTGMCITEHSGLLGAPGQLNPDAAIHSIVSLIRCISQRAASVSSGIAAVYTHASSSRTLFFYGGGNLCQDAPRACLLFDSHPSQGALLMAFQMPDELARFLLEKDGFTPDEIAAEFAHADTDTADLNSTEHKEHRGVTAKLVLTRDATQEHSVQKSVAIQAESTYTPARQFELLELMA